MRDKNFFLIIHGGVMCVINIITASQNVVPVAGVWCFRGRELWAQMLIEERKQPCLCPECLSDIDLVVERQCRPSETTEADFASFHCYNTSSSKAASETQQTLSIFA